MSFVIQLFLFNAFSFADFTSPNNKAAFIVVHGQLEVGEKGLDRIESSQRTVIVPHQNILQHNKTDLHHLLKRKSFKIKITDIRDIVDKGKDK